MNENIKKNIQMCYKSLNYIFKDFHRSIFIFKKLLKQIKNLFFIKNAKRIKK